MGIIQEKANAIAAGMEENNVERRLAFDIAMISTIIGIIQNVIQIFQQCKQTSQQAAVSMRSGGVLERWRLRRVIRAHINDPEMDDHVGSQLFGSALHVSSTLKDEEVSQMYDEVNQGEA